MSLGTGNTRLGSLERVELESVWPNEAQNFTPWLVEPENLRILGDTLDMELEPEEREVPVGPFSADILCKDSASGGWVVIENQIKRTDHGHLGQVLTYAAGLGAKTLIWIAAKFTEEHRATLDWLNENTVDDVSFFGLEIELWRIGDSPPAPKFNVVCKPNDWSKAVKGDADGRITPYNQLRLEFWTAFKAYMDENSSLKTWKASPAQSLMISIGSPGFVMFAVMSKWNSISASYAPELRVELYSNSPTVKEQFAKLESMKEQLQAEIDLPLRWHNPDSGKIAKVYVCRDADFMDRSLWPEQFEWLARYLNKLKQVFKPTIEGL